MCGIAGWINLKEDIGTMGPVLEKMSETLKNRGPDAHGEWYSPHAMLVHRRLAVVDRQEVPSLWCGRPAVIPML
jgi:asparagine synthase (glutamine-hydrolysing)